MRTIRAPVPPVQRLLNDAAVVVTHSTEASDVEAMKKRAVLQWKSIVLDGVRCAERVRTPLPCVPVCGGRGWVFRVCFPPARC